MKTQYVLRHGDCREVMAAMGAESIDAIVSDPPYGIGFMGKEWDHGVPGEPFWAEALRVAKPGAHLVAFGGSRTFHRLTCAVEDAGWEIRDVLMWVYGSGFPKSLDVSKAIDKEAGATREVVGHSSRHAGRSSAAGAVGDLARFGSAGDMLTAPATDAARQWSGWGTALKPAYEPIILARKPIRGTVARNVQTFGTGAINVDGCRVGAEPRVNLSAGNKGGTAAYNMGVRGMPAGVGGKERAGRWPANVLLDEAAAAALDAQSGEFASGALAPGVRSGMGFNGAKGDGGPGSAASVGGASRFFYTSKASGEDRGRWQGNDHPTVKPTDLMRWLCRLVTPPGGLVLDPFMGSGSTGVAAVEEGFRFVGIDIEQHHVDIAERRLKHAARQPGLFDSVAPGDLNARAVAPADPPPSPDCAPSP